MVLPNEEMVDILLIYGECFQNAKQAEQRYAERFPERRHLTRPTFTNIVSRLRETGSLSPRQPIRNKTVTNEAAEVAVLAAVAIDPHASSREMEREIGIIAQACRAFFIGVSSIHSKSLDIKHLTMTFKFVWNTASGFCIKDTTSWIAYCLPMKPLLQIMEM